MLVPESFLRPGFCLVIHGRILRTWCFWVVVESGQALSLASLISLQEKLTLSLPGTTIKLDTPPYFWNNCTNLDDTCQSTQQSVVPSVVTFIENKYVHYASSLLWKWIKAGHDKWYALPIIAYFANAPYSAHFQHSIRTDPDLIGHLQKVWTNSLIRLRKEMVSWTRNGLHVSARLWLIEVWIEWNRNLSNYIDYFVKTNIIRGLLRFNWQCESSRALRLVVVTLK